MGFVSADKLLFASYKLAYGMAKSKELHTIAKNLTKPCAVQMACMFFGKEAKQKLQQGPFSDIVISSRIVDMSNNIVNQVIIDVKNSRTKISI